MDLSWATAIAGWFLAVSTIAVAIIKRNGGSGSTGAVVNAAIDKHTLDCPNARSFADSARELRASIGTLNERIDRLLLER